MNVQKSVFAMAFVASASLVGCRGNDGGGKAPAPAATTASSPQPACPAEMPAAMYVRTVNYPATSIDPAHAQTDLGVFEVVKVEGGVRLQVRLSWDQEELGRADDLIADGKERDLQEYGKLTARCADGKIVAELVRDGKPVGSASFDVQHDKAIVTLSGAMNPNGANGETREFQRAGLGARAGTGEETQDMPGVQGSQQ